MDTYLHVDAGLISNFTQAFVCRCTTIRRIFTQKFNQKLAHSIVGTLNQEKKSTYIVWEPFYKIVQKYLKECLYGFSFFDNRVYRSLRREFVDSVDNWLVHWCSEKRDEDTAISISKHETGQTPSSCSYASSYWGFPVSASYVNNRLLSLVWLEISISHFHIPLYSNTFKI